MQPHPATLPPEQIETASLIRTLRRTGPGGQHRNKVETAVVMQHGPTGISAEANERRSQGENRQVALFRLRLNLALEFRRVPQTEQDRAQLAAASPLWKQRLKGTKLQVSPTHEDFPAILAELLDDLAAEGWNLAEVAPRRGTSTSQLVKFLKLHPPAFVMLNQEREKLGLFGLK